VSRPLDLGAAHGALSQARLKQTRGLLKNAGLDQGPQNDQQNLVFLEPKTYGIKLTFHLSREDQLRTSLLKASMDAFGSVG
jgi:hypothetical protein